MTSSESASQMFATLRFAGDALNPDEISRVVGQQPTRAYRRGQRYKPGPRSPDITGKTGVWYFSTGRELSHAQMNVASRHYEGHALEHRHVVERARIDSDHIGRFA